MSKKYCRFVHNDKILWGLVDNKEVNIIDGNLFAEYQVTDSTLSLKEIRLLAPIKPSKIICVGLNYHDHVKESATADKAPEIPLLFMKPPSAIIGPDDQIIAPKESERVDYEGELAVVIKSRCHHLPIEEALDNIFGYTCLNDVTARDLQRKDLQWTRAKGFDTFCPAGPFLVTGLENTNFQLTTRLNGEIKQKTSSDNMIFSIPMLISYISSIMTLMPGDVISTGTPKGVSPMEDGDIVEVEIKEIGVLKNKFSRN